MRRLNILAGIFAAALLIGCAGSAGQAPPTRTIEPTTPSSPTTTPGRSQPPPTLDPPSTTAAPSAAPSTDAPSSTDAPTDVPTDAPSSSPPSTDVPTDAPSGWRQLDASGGPSAREDHTWTVDGDGTTAYLFGGRGPEGASDELWAFDLASDAWSRVEIAADQPAPRARFGHTATWVPDVGLVVWSGQAGSDFFADTWAFNPESSGWRELPALGAVPDARYGSCASLGPDGELWISHGFTSSGRFDDTRSYNFESGTWTDRTPAGEVPVERCLHDCFWATNGQFVLFGGQTNGRAALGDLWSLDPQAGTWTEGPSPDDPARQLFAMAVTADTAVVFGGGSADGGFLDDTWLIGRADTTPHLVPYEVSAGPRARSGATLVADVAGDRLILFGGRDGDGHFADLWELGRI